MTYSAVGPFWIGQSTLSTHESLPTAYDLVMCVLSWETRCLKTIPFLKGRGKKVVIVHFLSSNSELERLKSENLKLMKNLLGDDFGQVLEIHSSVDHIENYKKFYEFLEEETVEKKRPLSVLCDMTCLAKRYLLFFLGLCFQSEFVVALDYLYAEGRYDFPTNKPTGLDGFRNLVSQGNWELIQIPYLECRDFTADTNHDLYISVGLEMHGVIEHVERVEPRNIKLFDLSDGDERVAKQLLEAERPKIKALQELQNCGHFTFPLGDVVAMAKSISSVAERKVTCLAIGSKPHALAMGIASLANRQIEVTCRVPVGYNGHDIPAYGPIHRFEIRDRFDPTTYRT